MFVFHSIRTQILGEKWNKVRSAFWDAKRLAKKDTFEEFHLYDFFPLIKPYHAIKLKKLLRADPEI